MSNSTLSFELTQAIMETALQYAAAEKLPIAIAVVDKGGHLVGFIRQNGVGYIAYDVCRRKATTAMNFNTPTQMLINMVNADAAMAFEMNKNPDLTIVPGGLPIRIDGSCVGGLGIAGGRSEQDQAVAVHTLTSLQLI